MKADACDYGDGAALARKCSKRAAAAAEEAEDADEGTPGHALGNGTPTEATPVVANGHGQFDHLGNGDSAAGTTTVCDMCPLPIREQNGALAGWEQALVCTPVVLRLSSTTVSQQSVCMRKSSGQLKFWRCRFKVQQGPGQQRPQRPDGSHEEHAGCGCAVHNPEAGCQAGGRQQGRLWEREDGEHQAEEAGSV